MKAAWTIVVTALLLLVAPARASAAPRVAVIGDDAEVTAAVARALGKKVELVAVSGSEAAVLADEHQLAAVVTVEVTGSKRKAVATVAVLDGASGKQLASYQVKGKQAKLGKLAAAKAWKKLGKAIGKARPPSRPAAEPVTVAEAEPAPEPVAEKPVEVAAVEPPRDDGIAASATRPRSRDATRWLVLTVDGRPFLRTLRYNDDLEGRMRPYDLAAPAVGVTATWVPRPRGIARFFALRGELELAVGINGSKTSTEMELPTSASEWSAGLRIELPVASARLMIDAAYSEHRFSIDDDAMAELIPDATYRMVRGVVSVSVPVRPALSIDGGAGWRQLLSTGDLSSDAWFPRSDGAGIEAELGATWRAARAIELFARADLRRYFFSMHPEVGDDLVVGGSVDQYLAVVAGVSLSLR